MVTKEELLKVMKDPEYAPMSEQNLENRMSVKKEDRKAFSDLLDELEEQGDIVLTKKERYALPRHMNLILGRLQGSHRGFGFVIPEDPVEKEKGDIFIAPNDINGAMDKDRVYVKLYRNVKKDTNREGLIERVVQRNSKTVVGTFQKNKGFGFVVPDGLKLAKDIYIDKKNMNEAKNGEKVVAEIIRWPRETESAEGVIREILGDPKAPGVDMMSIIKKFDVPYRFPKAVKEEASSIPQEVLEGDKKDRRDLRELPMVTIDGADAKDLDDAVSLSFEEGKWHLGVHIADVSHYVRHGTATENEALERATSIYLPDRVIPMLPEELSNGICSLNAGVDRLAMSCLMVLDEQGKVESYEIVPSLIQVNERMNYGDVLTLLTEENPELERRYARFLPTFRLMEQLSKVLKEARLNRGAIDFDFPEIKVVLNDDGSVKELKKRTRNVAESIIEEFMLIANETVAQHLYWLDMPAIYRVHEEPSLEKLETLNQYLKKFGLKVERRDDEVRPQAYQVILDEIEGEPYEAELSVMLLRSMMHARYLPECIGHFGLASTHYCHFTSPIRRYPDLFVHRSLKQSFRKMPDAKQLARMEEQAAQAAEISSEAELVAEEIEREATKLKVIEYMSSRIGEIFDAHISGVIASGFFVQLENLAEGLVRVAALKDDYYIYDEDNVCLIGEHTGKTYRIGDQVRVQLVRADLEKRELDFEPAKEESKE